jgi:hypothetical protein
MEVCLLWVLCLSGRGLCDEPITRPEESYRLWRVVVCDQEASKTRRLKPATGLCKCNHNVKPRKQTNNTAKCFDVKGHIQPNTWQNTERDIQLHLLKSDIIYYNYVIFNVLRILLLPLIKIKVNINTGWAG